VDTVFLALRVIVSLGAVLGALWFGHRWITKGRPGLRLPAKAISVAARQGLGAKAGVAIVEADGRRYLLGVTEHAVTVLDRLDAAAPSAPTQQTTLAVVTTGPVPAVGRQETRVVSVVTTGPVPTERLAARAPGEGAASFEQELALAASFTAAIAVPVPAPQAPSPEVLRIEPTAGAQPLTRRAARAAEATKPAASPLAGSILSPETWRQAAAALKRAR
jgi:flagellar biogenesis protein FliO